MNGFYTTPKDIFLLISESLGLYSKKKKYMCMYIAFVTYL